MSALGNLRPSEAAHSNKEKNLRHHDPFWISFEGAFGVNEELRTYYCYWGLYFRQSIA